jgi:DNA repair protein RecO
VKLFRGIIRILELFDSSNEKPKVLFCRFFVFFLTELGYEIQLSKCSVCGQSNLQNMGLSYKFSLGILCDNCRNKYQDNFPVSEELFRFMVCLKQNKNSNDFRDFTAERAIIFMEKYLKYHIPDFREIQSFKSLK